MDNGERNDRDSDEKWNHQDGTFDQVESHGLIVLGISFL
jgi:hypothetical protein